MGGKALRVRRAPVGGCLMASAPGELGDACVGALLRSGGRMRSRYPGAAQGPGGRTPLDRRAPVWHVRARTAGRSCRSRGRPGVGDRRETMQGKVDAEVRFDA